MADTKITALTAITTVDPAADVLPIVDVSDTSMAASGTTKKITSNQILGSGGTATLASATITGDLTVDTSTLKVDSANNRVGIGTASPAAGAALSVLGTTSVSASDYVVSSTWASRFQAAANNQPSGIFLSGLTSGGVVVPGSLHVEPVAASSRSALIATYAADSAVGYFAINRFSPSAATTSQHFKIDDTGVATWSNVGGVAGTAMTLNANGLGVGGAPIASHLITSQGPVAISGTGGGTRTSYISNTNACSIYYTDGGGSGFFTDFGNLIIQPRTSAGRSVVIATSAAAGTPVERLIVDPNGNCGIGVTPSAWASSYKALQFGQSASVSGFSSELAVFGSNCYFDTTDSRWERITSGFTSQYYQTNGTHVWRIGGTAGANTDCSFTQAMTLDASGNLLVGKSVSLFSTVGVEASGTGFISATNSASTNASTNLSVYSTGAAAFRFYVGLGGTVYATNTTISAISDQRLKENVQDIDVGLGAILALKPRKFDWKAGKGKDIKGDRGFIAQEFEQVFPNLIDEWKDAAPEGEAPYKSVRQDLIPVLVKAIQELTARVQTLETR